jgi:hypothetical protein
MPTALTINIIRNWSVVSQKNMKCDYTKYLPYIALGQFDLFSRSAIIQILIPKGLHARFMEELKC